MRDYELVIVYRPDIKEEALPASIEGVSKFISDHGGKVTSVNQWGRRKLAYAIQGMTEGNYVLTHFQGEPRLISALESNLKVSEAVLRHVVVRAEARPPAPPAPPAAAAVAPAAEAAQAPAAPQQGKPAPETT